MVNIGEIDPLNRRLCTLLKPEPIVQGIEERERGEREREGGRGGERGGEGGWETDLEKGLIRINLSEG